jgi:ubiquinone/menaquinone biosynthesis C-methylase UbiE
MKLLERRFWSLHSRTWDDGLNDPTVAAHITELVDWARAESPQPSTVIDLGCGTGNYVLSIAPHAATVVGVDYAPGMLDKADHKRRAKGIGNACFVAADLHHHLPFRTGVADMMLSVFSLQVLDARAVLAEARRVLVPGGHVVVEVPTTVAMAPRPLGTTALSHRAFHLMKRWLVRFWTRIGSVRPYSAAEIEAAVTDTGFDVIDTRQDDRRVALLCRKTQLDHRGG